MFKADNEEVSETVDDIARQYSYLNRYDLSKNLRKSTARRFDVGGTRRQTEGPALMDSRLDGTQEQREQNWPSLEFLHAKTIEGDCATPPRRLWQVLFGICSQKQKWNTELYLQDGFKGVGYGIQMTRPCSDPIEVSPLPDGIQVRPATIDQARQIWEAMNEAFRDDSHFVEATEEDYQRWIESP